MSNPAKCPKCNSEDTMFSRKRQIHICEDCDHEFSVENDVQSRRIFLSYGHDKNEILVRQIKADLENRGHMVWFDKSRIKFGGEWRRQITEGIMGSDLVLFFLSKHSTRDPGVCLQEMGIALGVACCNIQTILVEDELEVNPPPSISHIQWLDMHDWQDRASEKLSYDSWYQDRLAEIVSIVESEKGRIVAGEIAQLKNILNPENSDVRISELLKKTFVGRQWALNAVQQWRNSSNDSSRLFWVVGAPGVGKSAFAAHLTHFGREAIVATHFCQWNKSSGKDARQVVRNIAFQLASRLPDYRKILLDLSCLNHLDAADASELFDCLLVSPLKQVIDGERQRYLIVIDAIDEATVNNRNFLVELLAQHVHRLPAWLRVLVTSRPEPEVLAPLQDLAGLQPLVLNTHGQENRDDIRAYLQEELTPELIAGNGVSLVDTILAKSEGVFLYVEYICSEVQKNILNIDNLTELPQGLSGIYAQYFRRQFPDTTTYKAKTREMLDTIAAASEPMESAHLAELSGWNTYEFTEFLAGLGSMFREVDGKLQPFHKSLFDWLTDAAKSGPYFVSTTEGHKRLAEVGWQQYSVAQGAVNPYFQKHLPTHLVNAERSNDLIELLTDITYLEGKVVADLTFSITDDYSLALNFIPENYPQRKLLILLDEALRRDIHFISLHGEKTPQVLFQCLWNSCWWYDCPEAAKHYVASEESSSYQSAPWLNSDHAKLFALLDNWRRSLAESVFPRPWIRSHRPPSLNLGNGQKAVLRGHEDQIESVALSPDGRHIASASSDFTTRIWDAESGAERAILQGHSGSVESVCFSPDGCKLATGSSDTTIRIWDAATGVLLSVLEGHDDTVESVSFSPDGESLASGSLDFSVQIWNIKTKANVALLHGHESKVESVVFSPDGLHLFSGSWDTTVRQWDVTTGAEIAVLQGHGSTVESVACSLDGRLVASGSWDNTVRIWDAESGSELVVLHGHDSLVTSVAFSPDGKRLVSGSSDKMIKVWDVLTHVELTTFRGHESTVESVLFSPDGRRVVSGSFDNTVRIWDAESTSGLMVLHGHEKWIFCLAYSNDGKFLASGSDDGTVRIWDATNGVEKAILYGHESTVECVAFSPDNKQLVSGSFDNTARIWNVESRSEVAVLREHKAKVNSVAFRSDKGQIISSSIDNTVCIWDAQTGENQKVFQNSDKNIQARETKPQNHLWKAVCSGGQTIIESVADSHQVACFPFSLSHLTPHPSGHSWAGVVSKHLYIITLEEGLSSKPNV